MQSNAFSSFVAILKKKTGPLLLGRANKQLSQLFLSQQVDIGGASLALSWGANPNMDLHRTLTPLVQAQNRSNAAELTSMLLSAGADPNRQSKSGCRPLHAAAEALNIESAIMLIAAGADDALLDAQGRSFEQCARRAVLRSSYSTVQIMMELMYGSPEETAHSQKIASFLAYMEAAKIQRFVDHESSGATPSPAPERKINRL